MHRHRDGAVIAVPPSRCGQEGPLRTAVSLFDDLRGTKKDSAGDERERGKFLSSPSETLDVRAR